MTIVVVVVVIVIVVVTIVIVVVIVVVVVVGVVVNITPYLSTRRQGHHVKGEVIAKYSSLDCR